MSVSLESYWDDYARPKGSAGSADPVSSGASQASATSVDRGFGWTQYEGHGPGEELLGQPQTALELGCGKGNELAYLARKGVEATGVDLSGVQCEAARARWADVPGLRFQQADACAFLEQAGARWDAVYSIWGAVWFLDPERLLPLVRARLTPGGVLVFSQAPPVEGCYGPQGMYGRGFRGESLPVQRWAYTPAMWERMLHAHGFDHVRARVLEAPDPAHVGTLLVEARGPGRSG
ncbi:class I SAM-dependent methyltransferase [Streptomyces sp. NPDC020719]|uniref:class I SAM-dependent methyltransferase n=1 Tax=Streptomyces sp. NPDC020719 TaxID=3154896 RepID=UPI0033C1E024